MWKPDLYNKNASFVYELAAPLVNLLRPKPGERVLDLGCGTGELTKALADTGCRVVGVDASPAMVEAAREKGVDAYVLDGHDLNYENEFDAVFSNAALHWMKEDPRRVIRNIRKSLKSNGRFVAELGGRGNIQTLLGTLKSVLEKRGMSFEKLNPFYFPASDEYAALLATEGMQIKSIETFPRETPVPSGPAGLLKVFLHSFLGESNESEIQQICEEVGRAMQPLEVDENSVYLADYVRLRLVAIKIKEE